MRIVFLNGAPGVGKDECADRFVHRGFGHYKMSRPLKEAIPVFFAIPHDSRKELEATKDTPNDYLFGRTYRNVQIMLSEDWAKPIWGKDIFGKIAVNALVKIISPNGIVISDAGFTDECEVIINHFGPRNCVVVRITRPGKDFSNDSRGYLDFTYRSVRLWEIDNRHDKDMYHIQCDRMIERVLAGK